MNYFEFNSITVKDKFPFLIIDDVLDESSGAFVFSKIDLRAGYHQIRVKEGSIHKTAFTMHRGRYEFKVMFFKL